MPNQEQKRRAAKAKAARQHAQQEGAQGQTALPAQSQAQQEGRRGQAPPSPQSQAQPQPSQAQAALHGRGQPQQQDLGNYDAWSDYHFKLLPALEELRERDLISEQEAQEMQKLRISGRERARQESVAAVLERLEAYISDPASLSKLKRSVRRLKGVLEYHRDMQARFRDQEQRDRVRQETERQEKERRERSQQEMERRKVERQEKEQREKNQREMEPNARDRREKDRPDRPDRLRPNLPRTISRTDFIESCEGLLRSLLTEVHSLGIMRVQDVGPPRSNTSYYRLIEFVESRLLQYELSGAKSEFRTSKTRTARRLVADLRRLVDGWPEDYFLLPEVVTHLVNGERDSTSFDFVAIRRDIIRQSTTQFRDDGLGLLVDSFQKLELILPEEAQRFPRPPNRFDWKPLLMELCTRLEMWNRYPSHPDSQRSVYKLLLRHLSRLSEDHELGLEVQR